MKSMIRLVVFDLDGTLVDSSRDLADAVNALLTELDAPALSRELVTSMVGDGAAVLVKRTLAAAGLDPDTPYALERFLEHYDARLLDSTRPYPDMLDTLNRLHPRHRLAVLTNKPGRPTAEILRGLQIDSLFSAIIGGDSGHGRKPNPPAFSTWSGARA